MLNFIAKNINKNTRQRGDTTVIIVACVVGFILIAGTIAIHVLAKNESERLHKEMLLELENASDEDLEIELEDGSIAGIDEIGGETAEEADELQAEGAEE